MGWGAHDAPCMGPDMVRLFFLVGLVAWGCVWLQGLHGTVGLAGAPHRLDRSARASEEALAEDLRGGHHLLLVVVERANDGDLPLLLGWSGLDLGTTDQRMEGSTLAYLITSRTSQCTR